MTEVALVVLGAAIMFVVERLLDWCRGKDTFLSLQRDNGRLEKENSQLRKKLAVCLRAEQDRITKDNYQKDHGRDQQEVDVLRMLDTQNGKSVHQVAKSIGIGCELALKHLVKLSCDGFAESPDYSDDRDCDTGCEPYDSVWYITQSGREYLANNGLLY